MTYTNSMAQSGFGATLSIGPTPTPIGEVKSYGLNGQKWDTADVTNFESLAKEFITTIRDNGTIDIEYNRVSQDAGQLLLEAAFTSGALTAFTIQLPKESGQTSQGDKFTFSGLVVSRDFTVDPTKATMGKAQVKVSNAITYNEGS